MSLLEILVVVAILGILALAAMPDFSSTDQTKLDLAVNKVMQAIRMARSESMRTGEMHGLTISQNTQKIEVKKYDLTTAPVSTDFVVTHPIDKKAYVFEINSHAFTDNIEITNSQDAFLYSDSARRKSLLFDRNGAPVWFKGSDDSTHQLVDGKIDLSYGGITRSIVVAPLTGRVSEQ